MAGQIVRHRLRMWLVRPRGTFGGHAPTEASESTSTNSVLPCTRSRLAVLCYLVESYVWPSSMAVPFLSWGMLTFTLPLQLPPFPSSARNEIT